MWSLWADERRDADCKTLARVWKTARVSYKSHVYLPTYWFVTFFCKMSPFVAAITEQITFAGNSVAVHICVAANKTIKASTKFHSETRKTRRFPPISTNRWEACANVPSERASLLQSGSLSFLVTRSSSQFSTQNVMGQSLQVTVSNQAEEQTSTHLFARRSLS